MKVSWASTSASFDFRFLGLEKMADGNVRALYTYRKYDPDQPRDEGGRWSDSGMMESAGGLEGAEVFVPPEGLKVYHGTSTKYVDEIKAEGLKSLRALTDNKDHLIGARGESVFVTDDLGTARSYAQTVAANHTVGGDVKYQPLLLEIRLPPSARAKKDPWTERALMVEKGIPPSWIARVSTNGKDWEALHKQYVKSKKGIWYLVVFVNDEEES